MRIISVSAGSVTAMAGEDTRRIPSTQIARVTVRENDSLLNGALIGAGVGVASGLFICRLTEPWEVCRNDVGPLVRMGALGAGIGIGIDALIRGRKTIYDARAGSPALHATPLVGRRGAGLQLSIAF